MLNGHIYLYGPPGSGKTQAGEILAARLNRPFIDLDEEIEEQVGLSIADFFQQYGETPFRQIESEALVRVSAGVEGKVISLGGGALLAKENQALARQAGEIVCLMAGFETLLQHVESEARKRPLLTANPRQRLQELLAGRMDHYHQFSILDVGSLTPEQTVDGLQILLGEFYIDGMGAGYPAHVQKDLLSKIGEIFRQSGLNGPVAIVSDENVAPLYLSPVIASLEQAGYASSAVTIAAGEQHKTIASINHLWDHFLKAGLERRSTVLALGGGVITDLAGFAASAYMRGVPWAACPTSLLGMVDASLGGKTGVDLPQGKNLVGSFYPPKLVVADPNCLGTLPDVETRNGMAEVLKHGVISSPGIVDSILGGQWQRQMDVLAAKAMLAKISVIREDPYEQGRRAILNFGHTLGHAIEWASAFRLRHGEAVGLGMLGEARIAARMQMCGDDLPEVIRNALQKIGLPERLPADIDLEAAMDALWRDKKRSGGRVKFVLPELLGQVNYGNDVEEELVREVLVGLGQE